MHDATTCRSCGIIFQVEEQEWPLCGADLCLNCYSEGRDLHEAGEGR